MISGFDGIEVRKVKEMGRPHTVCLAPQRKEERDWVWPLGPVEASGGWNGECVCWGQEGMKLVREAGVS